LGEDESRNAYSEAFGVLGASPEEAAEATLPRFAGGDKKVMSTYGIPVGLSAEGSLGLEVGELRGVLFRLKQSLISFIV
jgi:hypothetical protein